MSEKHLHVSLIRHTADMEELAALAARLCYSAATVDKLRDKIEKNDQQAFVRRLLDMGHESVMEHATFTFAVEGVSRVVLAQLTRHRLASFSVQSQRYVSFEKGFGYIVPPRIKELGEDAVAEYEQQMATMHRWYCDWQEKLGKNGESSNEDARFVLPGACETRLILTMNVRELWHFFSLRTCNRAQWEIRALAWEMLRQCAEVCPILFEKAGPGCVCGHCPEGEKSCGKAAEMRAKQKALFPAEVE